MQTRRAKVTSPSGERFLISCARCGSSDTTRLYAGPLFWFRRYAPLLDLVGWTRNKVQRQGRWVVAGAKLGADGRPTVLVHSSYESDQKSARVAAQNLKRQIELGAVT